MTAVAECRH